MTVAVSILPEQQLAVLNEAYRRAVARKRLRLTLATAVFFAALVVASIGAEVNLRTFFTYFGNFISYFDRIVLSVPVLEELGGIGILSGWKRAS